MSLSFTSASSMYLENANAVVSGFPLSISCWAKPTNTGAVMAFAGLFKSTSAFDYYYIGVNNSTRQSFASQGGPAGGTAFATALGNYTSGTWIHVGGVFASSTLRSAYRDGANKGDNTTSLASGTALNRTAVGRQSVATPTFYTDGLIAEVGFWNVALNENEMAALGRGVSPRKIRREALMAYYPVWGLHSPEIDLTSGNKLLTLNNSPTAANHAPVVPFSRTLYVPTMEPVVAAQASNGWYYRHIRRHWQIGSYK